MLSDDVKRNYNLRKFLSYISLCLNLVEGEELEYYTSKLHKFGDRKIEDIVDNVFCELNYLQGKVFLSKYARLNSWMPDDKVLADIFSKTEEEIKMVESKAIERLKGSSVKDSLEKLVLPKKESVVEEESPKKENLINGQVEN